MEIKTPYYEDMSRISNSNIGWYLKKGPVYLHKKLNGEIPEEKNSTLKRGTMIHEYLLQPEEFNKDYVVFTSQLPSSLQQTTFCTELANSTEIEPNKAILSAYKTAYSTNGKTDDKMLSEGLKIADTLKDYIRYIKDKDERIIIKPYDITLLENIKKKVKAHKSANRHINLNESKNEFHINWEHNGVKCKSLLDSVCFIENEKTCIIQDLKTTSKLWHFEDSIKEYDYLRQLCFYYMASKWYIDNELKSDSKEWNFFFFIIAIDTVEDNDVRVFFIDKEDVLSREDTINDILAKIKWHIDTGIWNCTKEYYEGTGCEKLNL